MDPTRSRTSFSWRLIAFMILVSLLAVSLFLWRSMTMYRVGFPLDDAWIHQTYARNLAIRGEWAFLSYEVSAGSTAPLWTVLLSIGYLFSLPNTAFSFVLGWLTLLVIAALIGGNLRIWHSTKPLLVTALLIMMLFEWHLLWAALSGMETLLLSLHILLVLRGLERGWNPMILGGLVGLGIWVRPDAILAVVPIVWVELVTYTSPEASARKVFGYAVGFSLLALPYAIFNYSLGGEWWPSTFYAKQSEYAVTREATLVSRVVKMGLVPLIGPTVLLLPGIFISANRNLRTRNWSRLAPLLWLVAFLIVYALRLPVDYQHGRYMLPVIPALFLLGYDGLLLVTQGGADNLRNRIVKRSWIVSLVILTVIFWLRGAQAYAADVAIIETEMVATAKWIKSNTQAEDLIAAHDIGALGFISERRIIDLAGLISPDVIPILRDENALETFLNEREADYLVTFPDWYPELTAGREVVFSTEARFSPAAGGENMTVYRWR